jgi:hypothetical protein
MRPPLLVPIIGFMSTLLLAAFLAKAGHMPNRCTRFPIPTHFNSSGNEFEVAGSWISLEDDGTFTTDLGLLNKTGRSLSALVFMINYRDEGGSILFSIPLEANLPDEGNKLQSARAFSRLRLNEPIKPGAAVLLTGRNLLSTTIVPTSAEVVYWQAKFSEDRSSVTASIDHLGYLTDPLVDETPGYLRVPLAQQLEPIEIFVKLTINEYGRVLDIQKGHQEDTSITQEQFQALSEQLRQWHFSPSVENGYAVQSELSLLVVFEPRNSVVSLNSRLSI